MHCISWKSNFFCFSKHCTCNYIIQKRVCLGVSYIQSIHTLIYFSLNSIFIVLIQLSVNFCASWLLVDAKFLLVLGKKKEINGAAEKNDLSCSVRENGFEIQMMRKPKSPHNKEKLRFWWNWFFFLGFPIGGEELSCTRWGRVRID